MILIDFSQIGLSGTFAFAKSSQNKLLSEGKDPQKESKDIFRHIILSQLKHYKKTYGIEYGEMVISCDSRHYWRADIFSQYKILRKAAREESEFDWKMIFSTINEIIDDLRENFPYQIVKAENAESDDIIATITKHVVETNPEEKILIVSSDQDFVQLHKYNNVYQISPRDKKFISVDDPVKYLKEKIIRGDHSDYIPNIFSNDDVFVAGCRQQPVTKKKLEEYIKVNNEDEITDPIIKQHYIRNKTLIDFDYIPDYIREKIMNEYNKPITGNKVKVFNYLIEHKCASLIKDIDNF